MNGAESLARTLLAGGCDVCFTNPGNTELHLLAAMEKQPAARCVLGLFEGVITGAADGYARMAGKPACTLLHLRPGLTNSLANLHNAVRARVPMINMIGEQASCHLHHDAPLNCDIEAVARPFSNWLRTVSAASEAGRDAAEAIVAARTAPGRIATLIVPADVAWNEGGSVAGIPYLPQPPLPAREKIEHAAAMLRSGLPTALLLDGPALYGEGLVAASRVSAATGARLLTPYPLTRLERGAGAAIVQRIPYPPELAAETLGEFRQLVLVGASVPVPYFAYPHKGSVLTAPGCDIFTLASPGEDYIGALDAVASALSVRGSQLAVEKPERPPLPHGEITLPGLAAAVGALLPENAIVVDESMTSGRGGMMTATKGAPPHDWLANPGGAIGIGLPVAVGAAVACPDRRVLCLAADGSSMYTLQALWTMAREGLRVTTVIFANREYAVIKGEFTGLGLGAPGQRALDMMEIGRPDLDWVHLAKGMGVPGVCVHSLDEFAAGLRASFASDGPMLIQVPL